MSFEAKVHSPLASTSGSGSSSSSSTSSTSSSSSSNSSSSEDEIEESITDETKSQFVEAKHQYRDLKMKLLQSIKENEILTDELRRYQRKLLRLNRDKYFLFERLLPYEKPPPKQTAPKEETIEIVDGVPKVIRVGKKRGPKPKKREKSPQSMTPFFSSPLGGGSMEPGQSLLKLKGGQKKRGPKKKDALVDTIGEPVADSPTSADSVSNVTFSPGISRDKKLNMTQRHELQNEIPKGQKAVSSQMFHHSSPPPPLELSNSTTQDSMISFKSDVVDRSEFFRHDSFSNEMPDNLFDDC